MSDLIRTEEIGGAESAESTGASRRSMLRSFAVAALAGALSEEASAQVHQHVAEEKKAVAGGVYKPKLFNAHEFETLAVLSDIIIPGARKAGAVEFIDLLASNNGEFAYPFTGGLLWLDDEFDRRFKTSFLKATGAQRTEVLELIAYRKNMSPALGPGIEFFDFARRMSSDAYFTSREGTAEIGFMGNKAIAEFKVPQEVIDFVNKRSPV
ncbi:MAG: gluconate 2-dehydrogenase subunit 3 family protein [Acidobacteriota bacterium]